MARGRSSAIYGSAVSGGVGVPAVIDQDPAVRGGYAIEQLDNIVGQLVKNASEGAILLGQYTPLVDGLLRKLQEKLVTMAQEQSPMFEDITMLVGLADQVSTIIERVSKLMLSTVRAKDEATRLRVFLMGEQKSKDLDNLSEVELRKLVIEAAGGFQKKEADVI